MKKIIAAVIGMGIGEKHLQAIHGYKNASVKVICEKNKNKIRILKKKYPKIKIIKEPEEIFKNQTINLVSIASYDDTHFDYVIKSIRSNKNIIIEKPMCLNLNQLKEINKKIKKNKKIKICSNLVLRVNNLFMSIRKKIDAKKIFYIEADYLWGRKYKLSGWRSKTQGYSITLGAGIHMFDLIMWFLNMKPKTVQAFASKKDNIDTGFKLNSLAIYILKFPKNILAKVTVNSTGAFKHFHEIKIFQKNKTFLNYVDGAKIYEYKNKNVIQKKLNGNYPDKNNRKKLIRNFLDHLNDSKIKPIMSYSDQVNLMNICFAADKSINTGKPEKIIYFK